MKIIDIGICTDNVDPKGIGRIRCVRYSDYVGEKEKALKYEPWSDTDIFVAQPFLPSNINFVPEIGQAVKIINYNTEKDEVNIEYIAGPFTTMFDFNSQTFSQQTENTTYGVAMKHTADIRKKTGQFINDKSEGTLAKERDFGVYGKYGSDIIFTENGLQLRGGKLLSKEAASAENKKTMLTYPLRSEKSSVLYLKKFPKTGELAEKETQKEVVDVQQLKFVVEYDVNSLSNPTRIDFYVYKVVNSFGKILQTNFFNENTPLPGTDVKLINVNNSGSTPTFSITGIPSNEIQLEIRTTLTDLHENCLNETIRRHKHIVPNTGFTSYNNDDLHPFYFRPTQRFRELKPLNQTEDDLKTTILNGVYIINVGPTSGLVWSTTTLTPKPKIEKVIQKYLKTLIDSPEQSFSAVKSDRMYFLSTDEGLNKTNLSIKFNELDRYELTQEDYIKKIEPNTYATVRGENLVNVLRAIVNVIFTHRHNINKSIIGQPTYDDGNKLRDLIKTLENDILNNAIRIN